MTTPDAPGEELQPSSLARVLAFQEASCHSLATLAAAVRVAERQERELLVLVVEDQDLLHSAAFPFAREVGGHSGRVRRLSVAGLEAGLAREGERVRRALASAVAGRPLRHSLEVRRGRVLEEALSLVLPGDLLLVDRGARLGSAGLKLILAAPCPVMVWSESGVTRRAEAAAGPLRVLVEAASGEPPPVPEPLSALFDEVLPMAGAEAASLSRRLAGCRTGALLMRRETLRALLTEDPTWLSRLTLPVIVVP